MHVFVWQAMFCCDLNFSYMPMSLKFDLLKKMALLFQGLNSWSALALSTLVHSSAPAGCAFFPRPVCAPFFHFCSRGRSGPVLIPSFSPALWHAMIERAFWAPPPPLHGPFVSKAAEDAVYMRSRRGR